MLSHIDALRLMVRGAYDLQKIRIQVGLRLSANFRSKLTDQPAEEEGEADEMSEEAEKLITQLKASYRRLCDGVARHRTLPEERHFKGDELISSFSELVLVDQYIRLESQESLHFRQMESTLDKIPIYTEYLSKQRGIGPAMAGVLITYLDPEVAPNISSFWAYAGLDVAKDGAGRSRRTEHLVEREYKNKAGAMAKRMSVTYNPFLKTKLTGVLGTSFLRSASPWRDHYDRYKHRIETDTSKIKITVVEWKKLYAARKKERGGEISISEMREYWPPGRIHNASVRYMVKMFLAEFWTRWRTLENLPVTAPYHEAVLGHTHHARRI